MGHLSHLSGNAPAGVSTVPQEASDAPNGRLPGFIGPVPQPALDKSMHVIPSSLLSYLAVSYMEKGAAVNQFLESYDP
jgi:hypothetical protein